MRGALQRRHLLLATGAAAGLQACGFELRRPPVLPFKSVVLIDFAPRSSLGDELRRSLSETVEVKPSPVGAEVVLQAMHDGREKSVVASTAAGQVREVQLRVRFSFRLSTVRGRELLPVSELLLTRDMTYNETAALAKEQEEAELYRAMDIDIVSQVLRRLASVKAV